MLDCPLGTFICHDIEILYKVPMINCSLNDIYSFDNLLDCINNSNISKTCDLS